MATLNEVFSTLSAARRYEVWFVRLGLADGSGAWWFRYLLMNPGRSGCVGNPQGMPVQVWATWFPANDAAQSFIQGFPLPGFSSSSRGQTPFHFQIGDNEIGEDFCRGALNLNGHNLSWNLQYHSTFRVTLSSKGWIGFSRTPHSDATFSGEITLDGRTFSGPPLGSGQPLGFGVQGHNCGYRHRNFWRWAHAYFPRPGHAASTLETLVYEIPLGLVFRKTVLWHEAKEYIFRNVREIGCSSEEMKWDFECRSRGGLKLKASIDGSGLSVHRLSYLKTNCSGAFNVMNNSLAKASLLIEGRDGSAEKLETASGAVLEMVG
ncbi:MAG: hypothetical protein WCF26_27095 [Candidatus Sulfotelmatobacter sp.]